MELHIYKSPGETINALAKFFIDTCREAITARGWCSVALSGGASPKQLYELLASPAYNKQLEWKKIYFFFGDERYVPFDDPANNGLMVKKALFDPLGIATTRIFYIDTNLPPDSSAADYEEKIKKYFKSSTVAVDLVLLGLGDNAHTASLFPHTAVVHESIAWMKAVYLEDQRVFRITMTAGLINLARSIAFLVFGKSKAAAVHQVLEGEKNFDEFPAQIIAPSNGELHWFIDEEAATALQHSVK